jgi:hypothetical protein
MKIITVPEQIVMKDEKGAPIPTETLDITFRSFLVKHIDVYGEVKTTSQLRQAQKVIDAIEAGGGTISLEDEQYKILKAACEKNAYNSFLGRQLLKYYDAVEAAEEVKK